MYLNRHHHPMCAACSCLARLIWLGPRNSCTSGCFGTSFNRSLIDGWTFSWSTNGCCSFMLLLPASCEKLSMNTGAQVAIVMSASVVSSSVCASSPFLAPSPANAALPVPRSIRQSNRFCRSAMNVSKLSPRANAGSIRCELRQLSKQPRCNRGRGLVALLQLRQIVGQRHAANEAVGAE